MATIEALFDDRRETINSLGKLLTAEHPYVVFDIASSDAEEYALSFAYQNTPASFQGVKRNTIEIIERVNNSIVKVLVKYQAQDKTGDEFPGDVISFNITGNKRHITHAKEALARYPSTATDYKGAIEISDKNEVKGTEIYSPSMEVSIIKYFKGYQISERFVKSLCLNSQTVNKERFRAFSAGELLFKGADIPKRGINSDDLWEIAYHFQYSPNLTNFMVGDVLVDEKRGWDLLWVKYQKIIESSTKAVMPVVWGVYVYRIYEYIDFSELGL